MKQRKRATNFGQSMVEFALGVPFLLLIIVSILYFGKAYYMTQALSYASQEGARVAARFPNLKDPDVRDTIRGFTTSGVGINPNSVIYAALGNARLLSEGRTGNLPAGARVKILPWDRDTVSISELSTEPSIRPVIGNPVPITDDNTPPGTISILIEYPFSLLINPFDPLANRGVRSVSIRMGLEKDKPPVPFPDFTMRQKATVSQEVYEED